MQLDSSAPLALVKAAHLRYVADDKPGFTRKQRGRKPSYYDTHGKLLRDEEHLARIHALVIPPAWTRVWICPLANGHIQATGRDQRGRKQYRYHARWSALRNENKFERMLAFGEALPRMRARIEDDLRISGLPRNKVLAAVVRLLETTLIRVGNEEYARKNGSYGLTTLHGDHVTVAGSKLHFHFKGKSGIEHDIDLRDPRLSRIIKACQELPGQELFEYIDEQGATHGIDSADVNAYLQEVTGAEFTAKDFRTWAGTLSAALILSQFGASEGVTQTKRNVVQAIKLAAQRLGNTPASCRKYYVHPTILEAYTVGKLPSFLDTVADGDSAEPVDVAVLTAAAVTIKDHLHPAEKAMMKFLRAGFQAATKASG